MKTPKQIQDSSRLALYALIAVVVIILINLAIFYFKPFSYVFAVLLIIGAVASGVDYFKSVFK